ncbi:M28 family peptidase [Sphingomonas astaxanthinifaciens]|uniref:Aminopeptidase n=1 Tax=Sphingomonas astaxanthinifaciens DSM 22298 TaxID=1123267 RepID=A0ABQ5Z582_9SPHN|nr:M28 family peptidase [Sphingomonas astaxanthinifaciens]GLR47935.1 aminopeptidase [Sphingomonas astaxanthinifaciens DSM 22298]
MRNLLLPLAAVALVAAGPIDPARIKADVKMLSSDAFDGRGPGEKGEAATIAYLARQMAGAGLAPAGEDGGWFQKVPLVRLDTLPGGTATIRLRGQAAVLRDGPDLDINPTNAGVTDVRDAPLVFAGWGAPDPKRGWDAFEGVDVRGKVVVMLAGDPDLEGGKDLGFGGRALAFAGRGGVKTAAALKAGALGVLFIHEEAAYSWPYAQVGGSIRVPSLTYAPLKPNPLQFSAIVRGGAVVPLLARMGYGLPRLKTLARTPAFRAFKLPGSISVRATNRATPVVSHNVVGMLKGAERPNEYVLYGAHWDANGHNGPDARGDSIRNGAVDNATGTAELLEVARAFAAGKRPARSIVFAAWTSEEKGLLGAEWFAQHPLIPLARTAAVINLDPHVVLPAARNLELIGPGQSGLEALLGQAAAEQGLRVDPEPNPEAGWYFRSDHLPFAQRGVPALAFRAGRDLKVGGLAAGQRVVGAYNARCYHQPCDQFDPRWTFAGTAQEALAAWRVGQMVADSRQWPGWLPGAPWAAAQEASAAERR